MKIAFIILTYERPQVAANCIQTVFNNTTIKPSHVYILDDGSNPKMRVSLLDFSVNYSKEFSIDVLFNGKNQGVGYQFEKAYTLANTLEDVDIVCFIESDYVWRKGWLEDVVAVFEASPYTIAIAGCDHPDMDDRNKTHNEFCKLMVDQFGRDLESRENLYNPFILNTNRGPILVEGVSNSCGCQIVHWKRLKKILKDGDSSYGVTEFSTKNYWKWMDRAFHKNNTGNRRFASDAHMSGTLSMYAELKMISSAVDITKNFGFLNICDYSISSHICGGGINGMIVPEGHTFVISPSWDAKYLQEDPRKIENIQS